MEKYVRDNIRYTDESFSKIDLDFYEPIKKVASFCLWASIWTAIFTLFSVLSAISNSDPTIAIVITICDGLLFLGLGCWTYFSIKYRKPYSLFLARAELLVCIISWLLLLLNGAFDFTPSNLIFGTGTLIWGCYGLYITFYSPDMHEVFPKSYCHTGFPQIAYVLVMLTLPFLIGGFLKVKEAVSTDRDRLVDVITDINKNCPYRSENGELTNVSYIDNNIEFVWRMPHVGYSLYSDPATKKLGRKYALTCVAFIAMLQSEASESPERYGLAALMAKEKTSLRVTSISIDTNETASFDFSSQEVEQKLSVIKNSKQVLRMMLEISLEIGNLQCPQEIDEGLTMSRIAIENDLIIYICNVDEDLYDINYFQESASDVRSVILQNLQNDSSSRNLIDNCEQFNLGVVYRFVGASSGKTYDIVIMSNNKESE